MRYLRVRSGYVAALVEDDLVSGTMVRGAYLALAEVILYSAHLEYHHLDSDSIPCVYMLTALLPMVLSA